MHCSLAALVLCFATASIASAEASDPIERFVEIRIEPWNNTTPSGVIYGIEYDNMMIVNSANTGEKNRINRFTLKVDEVYAPSTPVLYTVSINRSESEDLAYSDGKLCRGNMHLGRLGGTSNFPVYWLVCSGSVESELHSQANNVWTVEKATADTGILTLRGGAYEPISKTREEWNPHKYALFACANPEWEKVVAEGSGEVLNYYEDECELHGQVRVKVMYHVVV